SKFPNVVCVYGTGKKMDLAQIIIDDVSEKLVCSDIDQEYADNFLALPSHTRAYVKIQDGCNNFCSYCIIPYMRGRSRSRTIESIKNELDSLAKSAKEIIFTGINTSAYGVDLSPNNDLTDIIRMARNYPFRFRFSSLEVNVITEKFLEEAKNTKNFCPHFHLSMQSGSDDVLRAMNRHYNSKLFLEKIALIRRYFPNCAITTDVIVGFPTETDKNFEETYATCKRADFADMHIFPFSPRKNTVALNYKNVATNVNERVKRLTELKEQMKRQYLAECEGKEYFVLVEAKESEKGYFEGHTENYIKCYLKGNKAIKPNSVVKVQIIKPMKDGALAEITE
ncbi:MAG: MiaB/RimO family radical SAM methylthiotransferase, partial [Clostridia bacterium]|nr:MiaB/RimO family radical SAM methylthiotransferase [Clostridia bacterium]